jgi:hypothetical protein
LRIAIGSHADALRIAVTAFAGDFQTGAADFTLISALPANFIISANRADTTRFGLAALFPFKTAFFAITFPGAGQHL